MWRNRTVCLVGVALSWLAAGCVVEDGSQPSNGRGSRVPDSGGYPTPGGGSGPLQPGRDSGLQVRWDLASLDGKLTDCDAADTPTVEMGAVLRSTGARLHASFPCDAGGGIATNLPGGVYDVSLDLLDALGRPVSSLDLPGLPVAEGRVSAAGDVAPFTVQTWDLVWTIGIQLRNGSVATASCGDVGATSVQFDAQLAGEPPETYRLPCDDYGSVTTAIRPGDYQVRMQLLDRFDRPIGDTGPGASHVSFQAPAQLDADFVL